jgi:Ni/Co efflux regulator RcnB
LLVCWFVGLLVCWLVGWLVAREENLKMKTLLSSVFTICLATTAPTALWAADDQHEQSQGGGHGDQGQPHGGGQSGQMGGPSDQHGLSATGMMGGSQGVSHHYGTTQSHGAHHMHHHHTTTRTTTNIHVNVDIASYHKNITAAHSYHFGDYRAPEGYAYHRYGYGDRLPQEYFARDFWIANFLNFGLIAPPDGYVWVRYGPDAILIDENTGEIVQVVYGLFY